MEQYIDKSAVVAEIKKIKHKLLDHIISESDKEWAIRTAHQLNRIIRFIDSLEVKEVDMPALDNGNMPIERWKEVCEAASCQANYRKSKGLTETCDDYFVDGVQWADEHPINAKEVDLEKELETLDSLLYDLDGVAVKGATHYLTVEDIKDIAKHFYELGLKVSK